MGKTLVIAEKPSVGRDLTRVLPGAFAKHDGYLESDTHVVTWAVGHLVQLAEPDEYDPKYKKWRMADLPIVPDRRKPVERLWLSSMTSKAIKDAFAQLRPGREMQRLEQAARSRSEADWIVGMNATRAATIRLRSSFDGAVSLGRVQTPTLAIIARREEEIRAFVPEPYWLVDARFEPRGGDPGRQYAGRFFAGSQPRLKTAAEAAA